jgi:hypothetical protein
MTDLYITYSIRERYWVSKLVESLESEGYSVWWDHAVIPGANVRTDSQLALSQSDLALVIWSETAVDDHWVLVDCEQANQKQTLASIKVQDCEIPVTYKSLELTDLKDWKVGDKEDAHFQNLLETIQAYASPSQPRQSEKEREEVARLKRMRGEADRKKRQREARESQMLRKRTSA